MDMEKAVNRLSKWRAILAGWQLGTRSETDPEVQAVRDHREATLVLRAELTALVALLANQGLIDMNAFEAQIATEAEHLSRLYEQRFPGVRPTEDGLEIDLERARPWMKDFPP